MGQEGRQALTETEPGRRRQLLLGVHHWSLQWKPVCPNKVRNTLVTRDTEIVMTDSDLDLSVFQSSQY